MAKVTKRQAERVLSLLKKQTAPWLDDDYVEGDPKLIMDWDWFGTGPVPSIVWEGGPYAWPQYFPRGGIEEEFGFNLPDVSGRIPAEVRVEAATHFAVSLYREAV